MSRLLWALFLAACLSQTTWAADPRSEAFCRELNAASTAPAPNKIYFKSDKGIVQLTDGMTVRRGQTPLYFFRQRDEESALAHGAFIAKITYVRSTAQTADDVILFNSAKNVPCHTRKINAYERFHGDAEEPNTCLLRGFHQGTVRGDTSFPTLSPTPRRREFVIGASGVDNRPYVTAATDFVPNVSGFFSDLFSKKAPTNNAETFKKYRSQIYNYLGQKEDGSCMRFVLFSDSVDVSADIDLADLLEAEQQEYIHASVRNITFSGN